MSFSVANAQESYFIIFDTQKKEQKIALSAPTRFLTSSDERGIHVAAGPTAVQIDPISGGQKELAYASVDLRDFVKGKNGYTLAALEGNAYALYDESANLVAQGVREVGCGLIDTAGPYVILSNIDSKTVQILKLETHSDAQIFYYDPALPHSEVRMSADEETMMLFRYDCFYLFTKSGQLIAEQKLPNPESVYDQQYQRDGDGSRLEVIYRDGQICAYSAADGTLLWEKQGEMPDEELTQTFETSRWRITAPLHGNPIVYDKESGETFMELEKGSYLTYITEVHPYLVAQFISAQGEKYGLLLNQDCETLAYLPGLCDVINETLLFDDQLGNVRSSRIYSLQELIAFAEQ